jgi:hypothetical protein
MSRFFKCATCNGSARVAVLVEDVDQPHTEPSKMTEPCTDCAGTGRDYSADSEDHFKSNNRKGAYDEYR